VRGNAGDEPLARRAEGEVESSSSVASRSSMMCSGPRVRYALASSGQSAATTVEHTGDSGPESTRSALIATSSAMGSMPESMIARRSRSECSSARDFHRPQLTAVAGNPAARRAEAKVSRKVVVAA